MGLKHYLIEARPQESYKNLLILLAPFFGQKLLDPNHYQILFLGFIALSLNSSACYIINDIKDASLDALHPKKRNRPIASGRISKPSAFLFSIVLLSASLLVSHSISVNFLIISLLLFLNSAIYSLLLRNIVWLDLISVSLNYVVRTMAGCELVHVTISPWLLMGVFYVSMLFVLAKRREEATLIEEPKLHRTTFKSYDLNLIDQAISIFSTLVLISYSLYTFYSPYSNSLLPFTIPLVTLIVLEFILISRQQDGEYGIVRRILTNRIMMIGLAIWLVIMIFLIYF
jgi:4-hydroxybenzoate polyprenyltransferase